MAKRNTATVDEAVKTKLSKNHLKKLGGYMKKHTGAILFTICLMLVSAFLGLLSPYFISKVVDVILPAKNVKGLVTVVIILILVQFMIWINHVKRAKTIHKVGEEIIHDIRLDLFKHLQELQFSYFDSVPHGKIIVRIVNYVNSISGTLSNVNPDSIENDDTGEDPTITNVNRIINIINNLLFFLILPLLDYAINIVPHFKCILHIYNSFH